MLRNLLSTQVARRIADRTFRWYANRRRRSLDAISTAERQREALLRLVRTASHTRFGREHDFGGIRSIEDYQERVPLRDYERFWAEYWHDAFPGLTNVTWPGTIPYFALSSGTTCGTTKYIPVSRQMLRSNRHAALTALAWFRAAHPQVPLFTGPMFFLGGSTNLQELKPGVRAGDLSGIAAYEVPNHLRPFTFPSLEVALMSNWEEKLQRLAAESAELPVTLVSGVPSWLIVLFGELLRTTGKAKITDIWPQLKLVIHGGTKFDPYRSLFRQLVGSDDVHFSETYPASEGFVAAEDHRFGQLRLIPDHGVFFEFVPVEELGASQPTRHTVANVQTGIQYAVILTTCAGLWSYVLGDTVIFESVDPPLLRFAGRTKQFLSAFGEHLIGEEVERAVAQAAERTKSQVVDFHVGPVFPQSPELAGSHRYFVEFENAPADLDRFAAEIDRLLCQLNEDYRAHRVGDLTLRSPEVIRVPRGGFVQWMRARGKLGGQHKVPRLDNTGRVTSDLDGWFNQEVQRDLSTIN